MSARSKSDSLQVPPGSLRILWVEDLPDDVVFGERELKKAGLKFTSQRVETGEEFTAALESFKPDVILSDHGLPQFNSTEGFKIYKEHGLTIPFILVTGTVSEEFAVSCLKLGIDDYVLKTNLSRLPPAILNALQQRRTENERKAREQEITRQNQKLEEDVQQRTQEVINEKSFTDSIINSMPGLFFVAGNGRFIRWNNNLEFVSGYTASELGKLSILDLVPDKDKGFAGNQIQATMKTGNSKFELSVVTKDGKSIPHYFTGLLIEINSTQLMVGMGVDISDLKNTQETLRLHDERMELAFSTSGNAWWDWDVITGKVDSHPNRYITLGYTLEDVNPHADWWVSLIHPDDLERVVQATADCLAGKTPMQDVQCRLFSKSGEWLWFHVLGKIVTRGDQGQPLRMIGTADNITKNKIIEQQLIEARYAAESANRTKGQFLANMSHEIRTPLNAVIGLSHLARKTELTPKQQDYLKKIQSSSESLLAIINDILDFSKIEAGKLLLEEVSFDLEEVLQKLADVITYKAYGKGLEIAFGIDSDVYTHLIGDPVRLEQVLSNLCSNAVKFTDKGEVVVVAKRLEESDDHVTLQFEVSDTGIGMDKTQLSRLFMPFTQADDSISRRFGGTGLGLSIIKRLVELMEGKVWVKSKPGQGSTFYFTATFRKQKLQIKIPVPSVDLRKLNVLIVDDNQSALKILKDALESFSFNVTTADSGMQAIHYLKNHNHRDPIKLVMIDWKMPEMDGLKTAEIIRNDPSLAGIKIIMMCTSYANEELYHSVDESGLSGILIKPIRYSTLYDGIMSAIETGVAKKKKPVTVEVPIILSEGMERALVLLVEDNEINQQVAGELLTDFGYTFEIATNGVEAVSKVRNSGSPSKYDLVLMDLQMPIMGGYKATTEIRKMKEYDTLPIIAMTADAMGGVREKCLEVGMMDFITKPVNPTQMAETLQRWVKPIRQVQSSNSPSTQNSEQIKTVIPQLDGVDLEDGLSHVNGNTQLYHDLLIKFLDNYEHFIDEIKKEFADGEESQGRRLVHTLKGMSANLGMVSVFEATRQVELQLTGHPQGSMDEILAPLAKEMEIVMKSLRKNMVRKSEPIQVIPLRLVKPMMHELGRLLKDQDLEAISVLRKIGTLKGFEEQMKKVESAIKKYDFDTAAEILDGIDLESVDLKS